MSSLQNLPFPIWDLILDYLDLRAILNLRKVDKTLRRQLGSFQLDFKLWSIRIQSITPEMSYVELRTNGKRYFVKYQKHGNGCQVTYMNKSTVIGNQEFATLIGNDIGVLLMYQKTVLITFSLEVGMPPAKRLSPECLETVSGRLLASLESSLKSRNKLLSVEEFVIRGTNQQSQIMKVLPYLDPKSLERIEMTIPKHSEDQVSLSLKMDEIVELEQWKSADEVFIFMLNGDAKLASFHHFSMGTMDLKQVSGKELVELREAILRQTAFRGLKLVYRRMDDKKNFVKIFGNPYPGTNYKWYFKMNDPEQALFISWCENGKDFRFHPLPLSSCPHDIFE